MKALLGMHWSTELITYCNLFNCEAKCPHHKYFIMLQLSKVKEENGSFFKLALVFGYSTINVARDSDVGT